VFRAIPGCSYDGEMKLRDARLCLDCDDVHADGMCPVCGSESFAFISRWVPAPEAARPPRPASSENAEIYRELLSAAAAPTSGRLLKRGLLGLTALGIAGLAWKSSRAAAGNQKEEVE
jgi:hypothetical protein